MSMYVSPIGQISFPALAEKTSPEYGSKFKLELIINATTQANAAIDKLKAEMEKLFAEKYPTKKFEKFLDSKDSPLCIPGTDFHDELVAEGKLGASEIRMKFSNSKRPILKLPTTELVVEVDEIENEFYAGAKGRIAFTMFAWGGGYTGISFSMQTVQKVGEGKRLGSGVQNYDFDALELEDEADEL